LRLEDTEFSTLKMEERAVNKESRKLPDPEIKPASPLCRQILYHHAIK